jgi:hypothetical protein
MLIVQAILSGLYTTSFFHCLRWLVFADEGWERRKKIQWPMLVIALFIYALALINFAIMVKWELSFLRGTIAEFYLSSSQGLLLRINHLSTALILDSVLVYRCWTVYAKSWRVTLFPAIVWLAALIFFVVVAVDDQINAAAQGQFLWTFTRTVTITLGGFFICSAVISIYTTGAIIYRILHVAKDIGDYQNRLRSTARIVADSGILYTSVTVIYVAGLLLAAENSSMSELHDVFDAINFVVAGITFHLIVIRVGQARARFADNHVKQKSTSTPILSTGVKGEEA